MATGNNISYTKWKPGQPDNYDNQEHYAIVDTTGNWIDERSYFNAHLICQKLNITGTKSVTSCFKGVPVEI